MSHKRKHSTPSRPTTSARPDDTELLPRKAFSVSGTPDFIDSEPQTAEEYLRRVKWEARNQPRVFSSAIDPRRFDHLQTSGYVRAIEPLPHTSARVMPSTEWESAFAAQFADIRLSVAHYSQLHPPGEPQPQPPIQSPLTAAAADDNVTLSRNCEAWARYCLGLSFPIGPPPAPSLPTVAAFDQLTTRGLLAQIVTLLQQHVARTQAPQQRSNTTAPADAQNTQIKAGAAESGSTRTDGDEDDDDEEDVEEEEEEPVESSLQPVVSSQQSGPVSGLSSSRIDATSLLSASTTRWLYCMLAHLQKPLTGDTEVQLRQLYRVCGTIRAEVGKQLDNFHTQQQQATESKQQESEVEQRASEVRAAEECAMWCNMLLTIVDRIFGQRIPVQVLPAS